MWATMLRVQMLHEALVQGLWRLSFDRPQREVPAAADALRLDAALLQSADSLLLWCGRVGTICSTPTSCPSSRCASTIPATRRRHPPVNRLCRRPRSSTWPLVLFELVQPLTPVPLVPRTVPASSSTTISTPTRSRSSAGASVPARIPRGRSAITTPTPNRRLLSTRHPPTPHRRSVSSLFLLAPLPLRSFSRSTPLSFARR